MKNLTLLIFSLLFCFHLEAQIKPWSFYFNPVTNIEFNQPLGDLVERANSLSTLTANEFIEFDYSGEVLNRFQLSTAVSDGKVNYFYLDELVDSDQEYILAAHRGGETGNIYLYTYFKDGTPASQGIELTDNISNDHEKTPAGVKANDGTYFFFGQDNIYHVQVTDPYSITILSDVPNTGGAVASAINTDDGFLTVSTTGTITKYDDNLTLLWSSDIGYPLTDIALMNDGYISSGNDDVFAKISKISFTGNQSWEQTFDSLEVNGITVTSDQEILLTGKFFGLEYFLIKTNSAGDELWRQIHPQSPGINVMESRYSGIWHQGLRSPLFGSISYLDEDGNTGPPNLNQQVVRLLDVNNIATTASPHGMLFNNESYNALYRYPKDSLTSTMFMGGLWIGGYDQNNNLLTSLAQYQPESYKPGPHNSNNHEYWDRIWEISQKMIYDVTTDMADGVQDAPIPLDMLQWPGQGNPNIVINGLPFEIDTYIAPFEDVNNDGIYNVYDGDYPTIKGDEMLWWIMNDSLEFSTSPLGIEIVGNLYAFACDDEIINNTTFLELNITNKSNNTYTDTKVGMFSDFDMGCYLDDYFGSLPEMNTYYSYNATAVDEQACPGGVHSFPNETPVQSVTFLNYDFTSFMPIFGFNAPNPATTQPVTEEQVYGYMNNTWLDGIPLSSGGVGYDPGNSSFTNFAFPDSPSDNNGWSMCSESLQPGDVRSIATGETFTFEPGQTFSFHLGMLTHEGINNPPCFDVNQIEGNLTSLQEIYDNYVTTGELIGLGLDLGPDLIYNPGDMYTLDAGPGGTAYLWSTGETSQSITVDMPGTYSVTVTSSIGCNQTDEINIDTPISTKELNATALKIYPNPSAGLINIQLGDEVPQELKLYNSIGQQVQNINTKTFVANGISSVDLSKHTTGIYFLACRYADGKRSVQQVVLE